MPIDHAVRSKGIGASEIAAVVGIDHRRSAFDVYAEKVGLLRRSPPTARMRWGKRLERVIADCYAEETGRTIVWHDSTLQHPDRPWQVYTPDAFVVNVLTGQEITGLVASEGTATTSAIFGGAIGGLDCKNTAYDQWEQWGPTETDIVPDSVALQCQWSCSAADLPWWDVAALMGGNDLRIYRVHRDAQIEEILLETGRQFWEKNVLEGVAPAIESTDSAREYLRQRYPRNVDLIREATVAEQLLIAEYRRVNEEFSKAEKLRDALQLQICDQIGTADGVSFPVDEEGKIGRVLWKLRDEVHVAAFTKAAYRCFDCRVVKDRARGLLREREPATVDSL
jgi:predicted phage-related endonuclease